MRPAPRRRGCRRRRPGHARWGTARSARSSRRCSRRSGPPPGPRRPASAASPRSRSSRRRATASVRGSRAGSSRHPTTRPRSTGRMARRATRSSNTMKLLTRISSILRSAWNACRSCSAASLSMCADSLARCAEAGWMNSPRRSNNSVTGCWASQCTRRPGSPAQLIGDGEIAPRVPESDRRGEVSTRFGRFSGLVQSGGWARRFRAEAADEVPDRVVDHDGLAGHRDVPGTFQRQQLAAGELGDPLAARERLTAVAGPVDDQDRAAHLADERLGLLAGGRHQRPVVVQQHRLRADLQRPADASSYCLVECGSDSSSPKKNSAYPRQSRSQ